MSLVAGLTPGKSLEKQQGSNICIKLTRRRVQIYIHINIQICTPKGLIITNHSFCHDEIVQSFGKQWKQTNGSEDTTGGHP
jgi:hypothetical protein